MLANDKIGREEKSPIHVADVIRMMDASSGLGGKPDRRDALAMELSERLGGKSNQGTNPVESSSRSGSRSGRRDEPETVGANTAEHKASVPRRGARAGVSLVKSGSVETLETIKRVRFDLREFGDGPNSQRELAEAHESHRSSDVLRRENRAGEVPACRR